MICCCGNSVVVLIYYCYTCMENLINSNSSAILVYNYSSTVYTMCCKRFIKNLLYIQYQFWLNRKNSVFHDVNEEFIQINLSNLP